MSLNIQELRKEFPILDQTINGRPLIYLDNAATAQKPLCVAKKVEEYFLKINGNIHRGAHYMANLATEEYENVRIMIKEYINAESSDEVIFTRGTTESINLVAYSFGEAFVGEGDEVIVTEMEHHANYVSWQMMCERKKAKLKVIPFNDKGELCIEQLGGMITDRTKIVAVGHVSNVLGTINPIKQIIDTAHSKNVPVLIDGAQGIPHFQIDVQELDCDFYGFSGHKVYGPTGVGVLYGKRKWLEAIPPFLGGGEMIEQVTYEKTTFNKLPYKFEAGTPNYIDVIGMGEAFNFVKRYGIENLAAAEHLLLVEATERLKTIEGIRFFGEAAQKSGVLSFQIEGIHHFDLGTLLDQLGIAVRTGRLCTDPIMDHYGVEGMTRASFAPYNTIEEIDNFHKALVRIKSMF